MKSYEIKAHKRASTGKTHNAKIRKEGNVPGVIYGGKENINFHASEIELNKLIFTPKVYLINLDLEGTNYFCHIQDIQFHPVTDRVIHVDLIEILDDKPISIPVPIRIVGESEGVKGGGKLLTNLRKLMVKGLAKHIPDEVDIDISNLDIGDTIQIKELTFDNLELLNVPSDVVVMVKSARGLAAAMDLDEEEDAEGEEGEGEEGAEGEGEGEKSEGGEE